MKRLRAFLKKASWLFVEDVPHLRTEVDFIEFELDYYENIFVRNNSAKSVREATDAIDLVVLRERDDLYYHYWPRLAELYKVCLVYVRDNVALFEDPIMGQGRFEFERVRTRYEHKSRILVAFAERNGYILV